MAEVIEGSYHVSLACWLSELQSWLRPMELGELECTVFVAALLLIFSTYKREVGKSDMKAFGRVHGICKLGMAIRAASFLLLEDRRKGATWGL